MELKTILGACDHTLLAQDATWKDIRVLMDDAIRYRCASVCIPPSFVKQAAVVTISRNVVFCIIPLSGAAEPSADELAYIQQNFVPYVMVGYSASNTANTYKNIITTANANAVEMIINAVVSPGYSVSGIESAIRQIMQDITNPLASAKYGATFSKSDLDLLIRTSVQGIQSLSFMLELNDSSQVVMPDFTIGDLEIFQPIDNDRLTVNIQVY